MLPQRETPLEDWGAHTVTKGLRTASGLEAYACWEPGALLTTCISQNYPGVFIATGMSDVIYTTAPAVGPCYLPSWDITLTGACVEYVRSAQIPSS